MASASTRELSPNHRTARRVLSYSALALLSAWMVGAVLFLIADGSLTHVLPRRASPPSGEHNLALHRWGPTVRASSYFRDPYAHHHPIFLVDGRPDPSLLEKWMASPRDAAPWVELRFRERRTVARVAIRHAGSLESPHLTARNYRLRCLHDESFGPAVPVSDNQQPVAEHALACSEATGVRIDFLRKGDEPPTRVFEIEVWGR